MENNYITKRQLKGAIDTMKLNKNRYNLKCGIVENGILYFIGKGYYVIAVNLKNKGINGVITYETLEKWYKLHGINDKLHDDEIIDMISDNKDLIKNIPRNIEKFFNGNSDDINMIGFNYKYLNNIGRMINSENLKLNFNGKHKPINVYDIKDNHVYGVLLPVRVDRV